MVRRRYPSERLASLLRWHRPTSRRGGARVGRGCTVTGFETRDAAITAVETTLGTIRTEVVVCAAGAWSAQLAELVGVDLPVVPLRRQILTTEPIEGLDPRTPFTIDFSTSFYFHSEGPGLLLGMSDPDEVPGFELGRTDAWLPRLGDAIASRVPALADVGIASGWAGLYEMTPDHNALVGEAAGASRFLYATGFSGHGFLMGPAIGEVLRDLVLGATPVVDVSGLDASRFRDRAARPELNIV